ncbi:uncharacterized protein SCHCODRAFT_02635165 [Schizophyllum commune H4-8]|uniref:Glycopeptide n=1 Tax=Schizophyllum commune (strain H4-8 / FGSC 9210) TaxID=578458 RepID=D8QCL3_SCHCM|nr:uncharacterized protein SCHCODRAFT_02635165 [Schizophyllum commune H4-8]KAI5889634.1 hypothetical protein SCHCODRAFT_02635165 [Schizophyllum commune H4-8]
MLTHTAAFSLAVLLLRSTLVTAESHTIKFDNQCGYGTPTLIQGGNTLSLNDANEYTSNGQFAAAIAYLQTGDCKYNGEGCMTTEITLVNPSSAGSGSSVDLSLIPPLAFNVPTTFSYYGGCDGDGKTCDSDSCGVNAFFISTDYQAQVQCQEDDVNLLITFCGNGNGASQSSEAASSPTSFSTAASSSDAASSTAASSAPASSVPSSGASTPSSTSPSATSKAILSAETGNARCANRVRRRAERRNAKRVAKHRRSGHRQ